MSTQAEVVKNEMENDVNLIRRFQKRVQGAGIIQRMRSNRYHTRIKSGNVRRKQTLKRLYLFETKCITQSALGAKEEMP